jgi:hypothetical protein
MLLFDWDLVFSVLSAGVLWLHGAGELLWCFLAFVLFCFLRAAQVLTA